MFQRVYILLLVGVFLLTGTVRQAVAAPVTTSVPAMSVDDDFDAAFDDDFDFGSQPEELISDPFQLFNRGVFWFNDTLYFSLFKPVARGYRLVVPRPVRVSVNHFFVNMVTPIRAGNALLQFKFHDFGTEVYRFVINTTFGVSGLFDPANAIAGVKEVNEDFGQTLGYYRVGHGFYLVLPIIGPSSLRDVGGIMIDSFADPFRYDKLKTVEYVGVKLIDAETRLSLDLDTYEGITHDALDPYLFIRAAYAQRRQAQVGKDTFNVHLFSSPLFDSDFF